ncbi:hypothetical protein [Chryseobacterium sp. JV558]|uniref:hypothetical protein n=1 Tax=Chryseobacterium sp. JV558 TaxID=2663236 RepID=UPI00299D323B|nr:hypothetical protein [Chryseobacterium sp. JV558]MDW9378742.1 hypothetical protein [Chryseobacterium sp. JV558]
MKDKLLICLLIIFSKILYAQHYDDWRSQFVKWNVGASYAGGNLSDKKEGKSRWINKYTAHVSVDVALSKILYFDSGELYLQPFFELSLPVRSPYTGDLEFATYAGGVHLKKYLNQNFEKSRLYLFVGGKLEYIVWRLDYNNGTQYHSTKLDYVLNGGSGFAISDRTEVFAAYSRGLGKVYAITDLENMNSLGSFSVGVRITLVKNWWFSE